VRFLRVRSVAAVRLLQILCASRCARSCRVGQPAGLGRGTCSDGVRWSLCGCAEATLLLRRRRSLLAAAHWLPPAPTAAPDGRC
jgi:hypothetical protein